jgi:hypothetical protein
MLARLSHARLPRFANAICNVQHSEFSTVTVAPESVIKWRIHASGVEHSIAFVFDVHIVALVVADEHVEVAVAVHVGNFEGAGAPSTTAAASLRL